MNRSGKNRSVNICLVAVGAAIIAVLAQISIPLPFGVPFTMQTFAIIFVACTLGAWRGFAATLVYVAIGAIGVPVFANFTGGAGVLAEPSGGFLLSFPLLALIAGFGFEWGRRFGGARRVVCVVAGVILGVACNYAIGTLLFSIATHTDFVLSLTYCVVPFLVTDAIKVVLAVLAGSQVRSRVKAFA